MASRLERLIAMDACIRKGGYPSVETLCRLFEVQPRTVHQDIKELRERFHLDIRFDRLKSGYFNAEPSRRLPPLAFTPDQTMLGLVAIEMLCHFGGPSFRGTLASVTDALISDKYHDVATALNSALSFNPPSGGGINSNLFLELLDCCINQQPARLALNNSHHQNSAMRHPKKLLFTNNTWFLVVDDAGQEISIPLTDIAAISDADAE